jgi:dTMP kinase
MSTTEARGLFITFEGLDGSGKTTQMRLLAGRLERAGRRVLVTVEPGGTPIGAKIRSILLDQSGAGLTPAAELLLYFASRAQNVEEVILPALRRGEIVLSDRFTDSTLVYQGFGRGLGEEAVRAVERVVCRGLKPDLTIYLEIDLETSLERARARNRSARARQTRMDEQSAEFYRRVCDGYRILLEREPERFRVVDGRRPPESVAEDVWRAVAPLVRARDD